MKEEPPSPEADVCPALEVEALPVDTPLSPTTFINSILQDEIPLTACTSAASPTTGTQKTLLAQQHLQTVEASSVSVTPVCSITL